MSAKESFYVMHEVDGDECLLADRSDFAAALKIANDEATRDNRATLSICSSTRGILVLPGQRGGWVATKRVTAEEARALRRNGP
jgi:hypothetical protein